MTEILSAARPNVALTTPGVPVVDIVVPVFNEQASLEN